MENFNDSKALAIEIAKSLRYFHHAGGISGR